MKKKDNLEKLEKLLQANPDMKGNIDWGMLEWASKKALDLNKAILDDTTKGTRSDRKPDYKFRRNRNHRWQ
jgi:hypothetical protein